MTILSLISTMDTIVLAGLAVVLACGAYDHWLQAK